jgi:single-strand DNA-binding protein
MPSGALDLNSRTIVACRERLFYDGRKRRTHQMLRVSLIGNVGADPELRYTAKGTQILSFRVAVNQVRVGPDGERQENTEWFRVRVTGRQVDFVQQRIGKGGRVLVIGRLDISHYQAKDGESRTGFDVWADDVQVISGARPMGVDQEPMDAEAGEAPEAALAGAGTRAGAGNGRGRAAARPEPSAADLEDLPF